MNTACLIYCNHATRYMIQYLLKSWSYIHNQTSTYEICDMIKRKIESFSCQILD